MPQPCSHSSGLISQTFPLVLGFPDGSVGKESACNAGDPGSIPGWGRSQGGGHGNPLQCSCPRESHGQKSQAGYSPWGHKESDMTVTNSLSSPAAGPRAALRNSHSRIYRSLATCQSTSSSNTKLPSLVPQPVCHEHPSFSTSPSSGQRPEVQLSSSFRMVVRPTVLALTTNHFLSEH